MASDDPMMHEDAESIGALFTRLVEDGKDYARAETDYYRALALDRWRIARPGVAAMGAVPHPNVAVRRAAMFRVFQPCDASGFGAVMSICSLCVSDCRSG